MMIRMRRRERTGQRGFTLIELIVVTSVVAVTAGVLLDRILHLQEMAERVAMQQTVRALRVSLQLQAANLIVKDRLEELPALAKQNPMKWLAQSPDNYAGEFISAGKENVAPGQWYFNPESKKLIYLVHNGMNFRPESVNPKQVIYQARLLRSESETGGDGAGAIEGVVLEEVNAYEWFEKSFSLETLQK
jgi:prepilin-type N-terminal cleavage/methylation domain-containing protein